MKVWTNGCFDIIHRGHIELFRYAKSLGEELVVGIDSDKKILPNIGVSKGRRLQNTIILNASVFVDANIKKLKAIPGAIRPNITPE